MVNWKNYNKEDRKFLINISLANRDYAAIIAIFIYTALISVSSLMIAIYSIGIAISGLSQTMILIGIGVLILIVVLWVIVTKYYKTLTKKHIPTFNKQYQEIHKTIHPNLFKRGADYYY